MCSDHGFEWQPDGRFDHDHAPPGFLALWGPDVRPGLRIAGAHITDLTPTMLHLLGLRVGLDMDGRVLTEALQAAPGPAPGVRYVETHDSGFRPPSSEESATDDEVWEQLRALGYVE